MDLHRHTPQKAGKENPRTKPLSQFVRVSGSISPSSVMPMIPISVFYINMKELPYLSHKLWQHIVTQHRVTNVFYKIRRTHDNTLCQKFGILRIPKRVLYKITDLPPWMIQESFVDEFKWCFIHVPHSIFLYPGGHVFLENRPRQSGKSTYLGKGTSGKVFKVLEWPTLFSWALNTDFHKFISATILVVRFLKFNCV